MTRALLLWLWLPLAAMAAQTNDPSAKPPKPATPPVASPVEAKAPVVNVAAPHVTVTAPTFPKGLSVQIERGVSDFFYDCLIALVGFGLNIALLYFGSMWIAKKIESYKTKESLRVSFTNEVAQEMDKVSKLLFQVEYHIEIMAKELTELDQKRMSAETSEEDKSHTAWVKLFRKNAALIDDKKKAALMAIEESRFWLGKKYYTKFVKHLDLLEEYEGLMESRTFLEARKLWEKIDASRLYASDFLDEKD